MEQQYIELINKEIDHVITPDEKIKLHNYLSGNKAAKEYYDALLLTSDYLNKLPDQEPTENLKKQIINSIDFNKYSPKMEKQGFWSILFAPKFRLAYTFAIGLIVGIIIYAALVNNSNSININDIYGTIGISNEDANTTAQLPLNFSDFKGEIVLKNVDKNFWFNLKLNSTQKFDVVITYPDQVKFENLILGVAKNIEVSKGSNYIKTTNSGSQQYSVLFLQNSPEPATIQIQILQSGNTVYDHTLSLK